MNKFSGYKVLVSAVMKNLIFWDVTPSTPLKVNQRFGETYRLHLQGRRIKNQDILPAPFCFLAYSSILKMKATFCTEMSVNFRLVG
jgi:hypothetical protein